MDYPPILPTIEEELKQFLLYPENLPIHQYEKNQQFWPREPNIKELLDFDGSSQYSALKVKSKSFVQFPKIISLLTFQVKRDLNTGEIIEFREVMNELVLESQSAVFFNSKESPEKSKLDIGNYL